MGSDQNTEIEIRLASSQLERMRAMQYAYHWILLWSAVAVAALIYGLPGLSAPWNLYYLAGLGLWAGGNVGYLAWFFMVAGDRQRMDDFLSENLGKPVSENS